MANFNDRLTLIEKIIGRMNARLADIESALYDNPLVNADDDSVEPIDPSDAIEQLQLRLNQVQTEIANLNAPGENVIPFKTWY
jgi:hypothetical protein